MIREYFANLGLTLLVILGFLGFTFLAILPVVIFGPWGTIGTAILFVASVVAIWTFGNDEEWQ